MNLQQGKNIVNRIENGIAYVKATNNDTEFMIDERDLQLIRDISCGFDGTYIIYSQNRRPIGLHRLLKGDRDGFVVDHKNRNKLDNRRDNLRHITFRQNIINQGLKSTNNTGFKGVDYRKDKLKFRARLKNEYREVGVGHFNTAQAAAIAYNNKALELHGVEFAVLNELDEFDYMVALFD